MSQSFLKPTDPGVEGLLAKQFFRHDIKHHGSGTFSGKTNHFHPFEQEFTLLLGMIGGAHAAVLERMESTGERVLWLWNAENFNRLARRGALIEGVELFVLPEEGEHWIKRYKAPND